MGRERQAYSPGYKDEAVKLVVDTGWSAAQVPKRDRGGGTEFRGQGRPATAS